MAAPLAGAPAAATASAGFATAGLNALVDAGAQNISFLAGDTSLLPEIAGNAAAQQVRSAYSTTFNTAMQSTLAGYAADGVIVHYLDGTLLLNQVANDLGAYGLTGLACPPLPNTSCIADPSQKFLFYYDQLHLTSAGFAIVGQYIAAQLEAPLTCRRQRPRPRRRAPVRPHADRPHGPRQPARRRHARRAEVLRRR